MKINNDLVIALRLVKRKHEKDRNRRREKISHSSICICTHSVEHSETCQKIQCQFLVEWRILFIVRDDLDFCFVVVAFSRIRHEEAFIVYSFYGCVRQTAIIIMHRSR